MIEMLILFLLICMVGGWLAWREDRHTKKTP